MASVVGLGRRSAIASRTTAFQKTGFNGCAVRASPGAKLAQQGVKSAPALRCQRVAVSQLTLRRPRRARSSVRVRPRCGVCEAARVRPNALAGSTKQPASSEHDRSTTLVRFDTESQHHVLARSNRVSRALLASRVRRRVVAARPWSCHSTSRIPCPLSHFKSTHIRRRARPWLGRTARRVRQLHGSELDVARQLEHEIIGDPGEPVDREPEQTGAGRGEHGLEAREPDVNSSSSRAWQLGARAAICVSAGEQLPDRVHRGRRGGRRLRDACAGRR